MKVGLSQPVSSKRTFYVYSDEGVGAESLRQTIAMLKRYVQDHGQNHVPNHEKEPYGQEQRDQMARDWSTQSRDAQKNQFLKNSETLPPVKTIDAAGVIDGRWITDAALFVMPGGADLPYAKKLNGAGNQRIKDYVNRGGSYLGICAGAYYASSFVEFDKAGPLEIAGPRELTFFGGKAIGPVFGPYDYKNYSGSRAVLIKCTLDDNPNSFDTTVFYNGGGYFEEAALVPHTQILATYENKLPAIIQCSHGQGTIVLSGVHFDYDPALMDPQDPYLKTIIPSLQADKNSLEILIHMILKKLTNRPVGLICSVMDIFRTLFMLFIFGFLLAQFLLGTPIFASSTAEYEFVSDGETLAYIQGHPNLTPTTPCAFTVDAMNRNWASTIAYMETNPEKVNTMPLRSEPFQNLGPTLMGFAAVEGKVSFLDYAVICRNLTCIFSKDQDEESIDRFINQAQQAFEIKKFLFNQPNHEEKIRIQLERNNLDHWIPYFFYNTSTGFPIPQFGPLGLGDVRVMNAARGYFNAKGQLDFAWVYAVALDKVACFDGEQGTPSASWDHDNQHALLASISPTGGDAGTKFFFPDHCINIGNYAVLQEALRVHGCKSPEKARLTELFLWIAYHEESLSGQRVSLIFNLRNSLAILQKKREKIINRNNINTLFLYQGEIDLLVHLGFDVSKWPDTGLQSKFIKWEVDQAQLDDCEWKTKAVSVINQHRWYDIYYRQAVAWALPIIESLERNPDYVGGPVYQSEWKRVPGAAAESAVD